MRPLEEARAEVLAAMRRLEPEPVDITGAEGRILAEDAVAPNDVPPFANSAMDGFAVLGADLGSMPVRLRVLEDVPAGSVAAHRVVPGTAIKIMTGAPMPEGADTVVKVELTRQPEQGMVEILEAVAPGEAVRPAGSDFPAGTTVLEAGSYLGAAELGLLASVGVGKPLVSRRPKVAVMATGDELEPPDTPALSPGQIRESNRPLMRALVAEAGGDVVDFGIVRDTEEELTGALDRAAAEADVIITSGGVSMGEYDLIKRVLAASGHVGFWQVAMQPAKPFAFGRIGDVPLFGLPGNPVSAMIAFEQFARPALLRMQGASGILRPRIRMRMAQAVETDPEKIVFVRVRIDHDDEEPQVRLSGGQSSHVLSAVVAADGLAVIPVGVGSVAMGEWVDVELFRHPSRSWA